MGKLFSDKERAFIADKKNLKPNERGSYKKLIYGKISSLQDKCITKALSSLLTEKEKINIVRNIIRSLKFKNEEILCKNELKKIEEIKSFWDHNKNLLTNISKMANSIKYEVSVGEIMELPSDSFENLSKLNKSIENILATEENLIELKINQDAKFIKGNSMRGSFFKRLRDYKGPVTVKAILKEKNKDKKEFERSILNDFLRRGIILPQGITKYDFIEKSKEKRIKNRIKHKNKEEDMRDDFVNDKEIIPFNINKILLNQKIRINPLHKNLIID
jgi:hypothetical protein